MLGGCSHLMYVLPMAVDAEEVGRAPCAGWLQSLNVSTANRHGVCMTNFMRDCHGRSRFEAKWRRKERH